MIGTAIVRLKHCEFFLLSMCQDNIGKKCGKRKVSLSRIQSLIMYSLFGFLRENNQIELSGTEMGRSGIMVIDLVFGYIHIQYNSYIKPTIPSLTIVWKLPTLVY